MQRGTRVTVSVFLASKNQLSVEASFDRHVRAGIAGELHMRGLQQISAHSRNFPVTREIPGYPRIGGGIRGNRNAWQCAHVAIIKIEIHAFRQIERCLRLHLMLRTGSFDNRRGADIENSRFSSGSCAGMNTIPAAARSSSAAIPAQSPHLRWNRRAHCEIAPEAGYAAAEDCSLRTPVR